MTTTLAKTEVDRYMTAVREALSGVADREDLLEDLEQHLLEVAAESEGPLHERLGPPADYAAELVASAGLGASTGPRVPVVDAVTRRLRAHADTVGSHPLWVQGSRIAREVAPGWWLARAYVIVLAWSLGNESWTLYAFPVPRVLGRRSIGLVVTVGVAALSWRLGRRAAASRRTALLSLAVTLLALLGALQIGDLVRMRVAAGAVMDEGSVEAEESAWDASTLMTGGGRPITNIYPYDAHGQPLDGVLLYDQDGRPIEIVMEYSEEGAPVVTSYQLDIRGRPVTNAFPQRQALRAGSEGEWFTGEDAFDVGEAPVIDSPVLDGATASEGAQPQSTESSEAPTTPSGETRRPSERR